MEVLTKIFRTRVRTPSLKVWPGTDQTTKLQIRHPLSEYIKEWGNYFSPLPFTLHVTKKEKERELVRVAQELQLLRGRQLPDAITFDPELRLTHGLRLREALVVLFASTTH
ncbi:hypothetical protein PIB30_076673, partial [Stylosanthes scabra]|nr:hypothetical protein [Stylosanthes scabra]